ncbi:hypothetical protein RJT34_16404 [Clitoria ternatea]|uniref:Uncharacterized protein n=1 Tax=Clitoria ternatea TaxID=43366 RepID=A0AAN9J8M2_CLITE
MSSVSFHISFITYKIRRASEAEVGEKKDSEAKVGEKKDSEAEVGEKKDRVIHDLNATKGVWEEVNGEPTRVIRFQEPMANGVVKWSNLDLLISQTPKFRVEVGDKVNSQGNCKAVKVY